MIGLLRKAGVNFPGGKKLALENLRPLRAGWLHAEAEVGVGLAQGLPRPTLPKPGRSKQRPYASLFPSARATGR